MEEAFELFASSLRFYALGSITVTRMLYSASSGFSALLSAKIMVKLKDVPPAAIGGSKTPKSPYSKEGSEDGSILTYCLESSVVVFQEIS